MRHPYRPDPRHDDPFTYEPYRETPDTPTVETTDERILGVLFDARGNVARVVKRPKPPVGYTRG